MEFATVNRGDLRNQISAYKTDFQAENRFVHRFLDLLDSYDDCFKRDLSFGHITASCWVLDKSFHEVLLMNHTKLNRWLQPGGHADGIEDLIEVAKKELFEETGIINNIEINESIFDLDIHTIPGKNNVEEHLHFDVRFLVNTDRDIPIVRNSESTEIRWWPLTEIPELVDHDSSIVRMVKKSIMLRHSLD